MEEYEGVKFNSVVLGKMRGCWKDVEELLALDKELEKYIKPKANEGNISKRCGKGFIIKAAGAKLTELKACDLSLVEKVDIENNVVYFYGNTPSSEAMMHYLIYRRRKDINFVVHFHDDEILGKIKGIAAVGPFSYGTVEQAAGVAEAVRNENVVGIKEHGFVAIGENMEEIIRVMKRLRKLK